MNNDNKDFDPMLSIPSMEELDRQWKEREAAQNYTKTTSRKNTTKRTASGHNNARNNAQRRTMAEEIQTFFENLSAYFSDRLPGCIDGVLF